MGACGLCFPALETLAAVNRTALGGPEGNGRFAATLRTDRCCFRARGAGRRRPLPLHLARLAALRLIFEVLIVEEMLLSRRENKLRPTIGALDDSILKLWHRYRSRGPTQATYPRPLRTPADLVLLNLPTTFLSVSLTSQRLLGPFLFAGLQVKRVPFHLFNNVLLLDLTLEPAKGVFQCFALLQLDFSQLKSTSDRIGTRRALLPGKPCLAHATSRRGRSRY
jgi:hypothetical protein